MALLLPGSPEQHRKRRAYGIGGRYKRLESHKRSVWNLRCITEFYRMTWKRLKKTKVPSSTKEQQQWLYSVNNNHSSINCCWLLQSLPVSKCCWHWNEVYLRLPFADAMPARCNAGLSWKDSFHRATLTNSHFSDAWVLKAASFARSASQAFFMNYFVDSVLPARVNPHPEHVCIILCLNLAYDFTL